MKTRISFLITLLIAAISCVNEESPTSVPDTVEFFCHIENENPTRTSLDQNNNVMWSDEDQLVIFKKNTIPAKYQVSENCVGKTSGSFYKINSDEFNAGLELDHNVALYPYQEDIEITKLDSDSSTSSYKITGYNFPAEQTYVENSFANGAFPMAAVSDNYDLTFRNICGGIKLQLKGTQKVTSIKIQGKNNEKLAGNADITVYSDETLKPAITMADNALTSVTLNCGSGVQLNESSATQFIIALPPMLYNIGFTVTITDYEDNIYTIETDKSHTILRSSLLVMPIVNYGASIEDDENDDLYIPVKSITINDRPSKILTGLTKQLTTKITPSDATNQQVVWNSNRPDILYVSQDGELKGVSAGLATISATVDGVVCSVQISVVPVGIATTDYIDEYGINHGKGIELGEYVWAPINCGFLQESEESKGFPYGKLYQWGRKYGQGLGGDYDSGVIDLMEAPVSVIGGQSESMQNMFFYSLYEWYDCSSSEAASFWNNGTLEAPVKTEYDPCPQGWRVPTGNELISLAENYSTIISRDNYDGRYFSGAYEYSENSPKIFLPRVSWRNKQGNLSKKNQLEAFYACYWASTPAVAFPYFSQGLFFWDGGVRAGDNGTTSLMSRAHGYFVRCVQE